MPLLQAINKFLFKNPFRLSFFVATAGETGLKRSTEKKPQNPHFGSQEIPPSQNRNSGVCSWHYMSWIHSKKGITYPGQGGRVPTKGKNRALFNAGGGREEGNNHWNGNIKKRKECGERDWKATRGTFAFLRSAPPCRQFGFGGRKIFLPIKAGICQRSHSKSGSYFPEKCLKGNGKCYTDCIFELKSA